MQHPPAADAGDIHARRSPPGACAGEHTALLHAAELHNKPVLSASRCPQNLALRQVSPVHAAQRGCAGRQTHTTPGPGAAGRSPAARSAASSSSVEEMNTRTR